jgi:RimJ/RimL family protein N-acetyltransferase
MAAADYWLTTERLALRRFTPSDLDWLAELYRDPDVMRYLGGVKDRAKAVELLDNRILRYYDQHRAGDR